MRAAVFKQKGEPLVLTEVRKPKPVKDQVLVRLQYAALNHRDIWITTETEMSSFPEGIIPGSDGSGTVEAVGEDVDPLWIGAEVIINPSIDWGNNPIVSGDQYKILGFPDNGTFAEYIVISKKYIHEKPEHLSFQEAAAVPLAALTAYRALFTKARLRSKEKVLITGIGGGVALWLLQFATAYQARVFVTSGSAEKIDKAKLHGAAGGFNYKDPDWVQQAKREAGGFDVIIDSAGGPGFAHLVDLALPGGRIVNYGRTNGNITEVVTRLLYFKQLSIFGTTMGTRDEFLSMLELLESRNIKPIIDSTFPLSSINGAFARMHESSQFGKIVLDISK